MGDIVQNPRSTIPKSCVFTCAVISVVYILCYLAVLGVLDWHKFVEDYADDDGKHYGIMALFAEFVWDGNLWLEVTFFCIRTSTHCTNILQRNLITVTSTVINEHDSVARFPDTTVAPTTWCWASPAPRHRSNGAEAPTTWRWKRPAPRRCAIYLPRFLPILYNKTLSRKLTSGIHSDDVIAREGTSPSFFPKVVTVIVATTIFGSVLSMLEGFTELLKAAGNNGYFFSWVSKTSHKEGEEGLAHRSLIFLTLLSVPW